MSAIMVRSQFGDFFGSDMLPVLEEVFWSEAELHPSRREQLFKVVNTDRDIWQATEVHDLPGYSEIPENTSYSYERARQGFDKTLSVVKYGSGFSITEEAVADGKYDFIADLSRKLARSGKESQEIAAMDIFNNGFTGGTQTGADGVSVFSSAKLLPGGSTFRNILSSASDLSNSSLETMLIDFNTQFIGDTGQIKKYQPKVLLVHPSNWRLAKELVGSDKRVNDVSSDNGPTNAMNSLREDGLMVVQSPHLTDSDAWFLLGSPEETGLRIVVREGLQTKASSGDAGFHNDCIYYKAKYREKVGATHGYAIFGTPGTG